MAARRSKGAQSIDAMLEAVSTAAQEPESGDSQATLRKALGHKNWLVVTESAKVVGASGLRELESPLRAVWSRFLSNGAKTDPGCRAKEAALTALDQLELMDPDPFVPAAVYTQFEPVHGGREDTAGGVRQRAACALLRMHYSDALLLAGPLLADPSSAVRAGIARALGHYGTRETSALLLLRIHAGDEDPVVVSECCGALFQLAPDIAIKLCGAWLSEADPIKREAAALTLGQAGTDDSIGMLEEWIEDGLGEEDQELASRGLGLSRHPKARELLLTALAHGSVARAEQALHALAIHNYDAELKKAVQKAAKQQSSVHLQRLAERLFPQG